MYEPGRPRQRLTFGDVQCHLAQLASHPRDCTCGRCPLVSRVTPLRVYLIASGWQRQVRDQSARTALRDHRGDRQDPRDTGTRRGQTAAQRLSEPRARLGWSGGGWVGFGVRLSRARAALSRAWADSLPENRLHGVIAGKLYTYASDARVRRWPNGIEITGKGTPA